MGMMWTFLFLGFIVLLTNTITAGEGKSSESPSMPETNTTEPNINANSNTSAEGNWTLITKRPTGSNDESMGKKLALLSTLLITFSILFLVIIIGMFYGCCFKSSSTTQHDGLQVDITADDSASVPIVTVSNPAPRKNIKDLADQVSTKTFTSRETKQAITCTMPLSNLDIPVFKGQSSNTETNRQVSSRNVTAVNVISAISSNKSLKGASEKGSYLRGNSLEPRFSLIGEDSNSTKEKKNWPQPFGFRQGDLEENITQRTNPSQPPATHRTSLFIVPIDPDHPSDSVQLSDSVVSKYEGLV